MDYTQIFSRPIEQWQTVGDDTQYLILDTPDEFVIAFYGTNSLCDLKNDFLFPKNPYKTMSIPFKAHRGFLRAWKACDDFFMDLVKDVNKPITIVGHSYGGAIATLCMEDVWFNYPEKRNTLKMVTYGAPRVIGWKNHNQIAERWEKSTMYCNELDVVCHVPFFFMGFRHVHRLTKKWCGLKLKDNHMIWNY